MKKMTVLIVDDEPVVRDSLVAWLFEDGYETGTAASGEEAVECIREKDFAACLVDLKMPGGIDGIETMRRVREIRPDTAVIIITAFGTVDSAVEAMKDGAADFILKPFNPEDISAILERLAAMRRLKDEAGRHGLPDGAQEFHGIVSRNERMHQIFAMISEVANLRSTVLIEGESGTGKSLVARAIHEAGNRAGNTFAEVSCGGMTESLLEAELFGRAAGSVPGATVGTPGKVDAAAGGTLLLDEVGSIPPKIQVDLLRILQQRRFFRVGGTEERPVDVRFIATSSQPLKAAVQAVRFREDLFFRLKVIHIQLPALRERLEDVPLLAEHFADYFANERGSEPVAFNEEVIDLLLRYSWPGNVLELESAVERAMATCHSREFSRDDFAFLDTGAPLELAPWTPPTHLTLRQVEEDVIRAVLASTDWSEAGAASILGVSLETLLQKIRQHGIVRQV
jgi:two-component system response regulator HydG